MVQLNLRCLKSSLTWRMVILVLFALLAALQVLHVVLLNQLEERKATEQSKRLTILHDKMITNFMAMKESFESREVIDHSGTYQIVYYLYGQKKHILHSEVMLVSHSSLSNIHHLVALGKHWQGPISVAVFTSSDHIIPAVTAILRLTQCIPELRQNLTAHLVFPFRGAPRRLPELPTYHEYSCNNLGKSIRQEMVSLPNYEGVQYPNNLLRNVAWRASPTDYVFVIDIDMLPSANLRQNFLELAHSQFPEPFTVFVVPAFEMNSQQFEMPRDKKALINLWNRGLVKPFYYQVCWKCQRPTQYALWKNLTVTQTLTPGYEVVWIDPWEPFYIAAADIPMYDERFRQYGFNRISQLCELHMAGYKFAVLNNAFLVHEGFKSNAGFHSSKQEELDRNRAHFRTFKSELSKKYPSSNRTCNYQKSASKRIK